jgi:hypothetical protein
MLNMETDSSEARAQEPPETAATQTGAENQNAVMPDALGDDPNSWMDAALNYQEPTETSAQEPAGETPQESNEPTTEESQQPASEESTEAPEQQPGESDEIYRQRVRTSDPMLAEVLRLQKENPDKTFAELQAEAQMKLAESAGIQIEVPAEEPTGVDEPVDPNAPQNLEELETRLDELMEAKIKAQTEDYDVAEAGRIEKEIYELRKLEGGLKERQERENQSIQQQTQQQVSEATKKAETYYPDSAKEGSDLHQEMVRIHETLIETGDDRVSAPDYVWQLAKMAAKSKGVAPVDPKSNSSQPAQPAKQAAQHQTKAPIASGSARSDTPPPQPADPLKGVENPSDYYNAMEALKNGQLSAN